MEKGNLRSNFGARGWFLVIYMCLTFFFTSLVTSSLNVSVFAFEAMRGWSQTLILSLNTIGGWVGVIGLAVAGVLMSKGKLKMRSLILASAIILAVAVALWGYVKNLAVYITLYMIYQIAYVLWAQMANQTICNNWFPRKKGLVIGWATFGFPLGAGVGVAIFAAMMGGLGLEKVYLVLGVICGVVGIIGYTFFREYPEQLGCYPDNDKSMTREQAERELAEGRALTEKSPWTTKRMLKTKETWLISLSCAYMLMFASGSILQVVPRLVAIGYTPDAATGKLTFAALCAVPGSYLCGLLDQKVGTKKALIITDILSAVACVLYTIPNDAAIWVALVMIGIALGGSSNYIMSITGTYWGRYHFQKAFGTTLAINQFVGQGGSMLVAVLANAYTYSVAYYVMAILGIIAAVIILPVKDNFTAKYEAQFAIEDGTAA